MELKTIEIASNQMHLGNDTLGVGMSWQQILRTPNKLN